MTETPSQRSYQRLSAIEPLHAISARIRTLRAGVCLRNCHLCTTLRTISAFTYHRRQDQSQHDLGPRFIGAGRRDSVAATTVGWCPISERSRISLGTRLLIVTAVITLALASVGALLAWRNQREEFDRVHEDTATYAEARAMNVNQFLSDRLDLLGAVAVSPVLRAGNLAGIRAFLLDLEPADLGFRGGIVWIDLTAQIQVATDTDPSDLPISVADADYAQAVLTTGTPSISPAYRSFTDGTWVVALAVPTRDAAGDQTGVLAGRVGLERLNELAQRSPFESSSRTLVVDRLGHLIVGPDVVAPTPEVRDVSAIPIVQRFLRGELAVAGNARIDDGVEGNRDRLVGYAPVPIAGWMVMIDRSAEEALRPARRVLLGELLGLGVISILCLGGAVVIGRRIDRLSVTEQQTFGALQASERRFRELVERIPDAVLLSDDRGRILEANPAAIALLGWSNEELLSRRTADVIVGDGISESPFDERRAVEWRGEAVVQRQDGTLVPVEIWHRPISLLSGGATIDTLRDITERRAQEQFEQDFLADVAHDLKTPLTVNKAQIQMLQRRQRQGRIDPTTLGESLAGFNANTDRMVRRLDELTDLARLRSGRDLELRLEPLDLVSLVQESVTYFSRSTDRHAIEIDNQMETSTGTWDAVRLQRVVENLLSNAIKYSPKGGTITVTLANDRRDNREWAIVSVRDQGLGIPATDLPTVFERYRRGSNVATRISGTGIGLAGAHHIVEQHGGTIAVESTEGVGSVFTVALPLGLTGAN